jgi:ACS family tartrate transporter-like MFS transporter
VIPPDSSPPPAEIASSSSSAFANNVESLAKQTRRRVARRLIPWLFFLYILAFLDRANIQVAALAMKKPLDEQGLGFTDEIIGFGSGIFFWGYWILEIPSTVSVGRWGARWVFVRILVLWGLCATLVGAIGTPLARSLFSWLPHIPGDPGSFWGLNGFVNGLADSAEYQLYFLRFMLGFFEGGFFPSVIFYLSLWFRTEDRAKAIATFMAAIPFSNVVGAFISGQLLTVQWWGLPGWRWIFILQGIAPILAGFATIFLLPDRPSSAKWLPDDERNWLLGELDREHRAKTGHGHLVWAHHLGAVVLLTAVYFGQNLTSYGMTFFMPAIIKSQLALDPDTKIQILGFIPATPDQLASYLSGLVYLMGLLGMLVNGWHSDKTGERTWHVAVPFAIWSLGIFLAAIFDGHWIWPLLMLLFLVGPFMYAHLPAFWPIPTMFLGATAAASAIGFINMIGNLGGSAGPMIVGKQTNFAFSLMLVAPWPLLSAVLVLIAGYMRRRASALKKT